jgi:segregation and condensation protein B
VEQDKLKNIVEAALLAAQQPLTLAMLGALFAEEEAVGHADLAQALASLQADCQGRGVELAEVGSGFRYQVRQEVHPWVARLWTERQTRYSRALLETLALIAYRQPITRGEIEQIRGVSVASSIMRTLEEREWIRVVGYRDVPGKPALFGTTRMFLDYFNLKSLDQLPTLAEIRDLEELEPQLMLVAGAHLASGRAETIGSDEPQGEAPMHESESSEHNAEHSA